MHQCFPESQPLLGTQRLVITPNNLRHYASFIHPSVSIRDRLIHVGKNNPEAVVIKIPLGKIQPGAHSAIKVTVGLKPGPATVDSDPNIGISDGTKYNRFFLVDPTNFHVHTPCSASRASQDNILVPTNTKQGSVYQMIFEPAQSYGACTTGYENGLINTAQFNDRLDLSKDLSIVVRKDDESPEEYDFYYFIIELQ